MRLATKLSKTGSAEVKGGLSIGCIRYTKSDLLPTFLIRSTYQLIRWNIPIVSLSEVCGQIDAQAG
jgi:hypothetical protein